MFPLWLDSTRETACFEDSPIAIIDSKIVRLMTRVREKNFIQV